MPYKKPYTSKTIGMGASSTPKDVMGSQGNPIHVKASPNSKSRPTGSHPFPGKMQ